MAVFNDIEGDVDAFGWQKLDCMAIVYHSGIATIAEERHAECQFWLGDQGTEGYRIFTVDCSNGLRSTSQQLTDHLEWKKNFGYEPQGIVGLDALNDGFDFPVSEKGCSVLELLYPEVIWEENRNYVKVLLDIATQHTRYHLAFGRRFLTLLVVKVPIANGKLTTDLIGHKTNGGQIPHPFSESFR